LAQGAAQNAAVPNGLTNSVSASVSDTRRIIRRDSFKKMEDERLASAQALGDLDLRKRAGG
jgi:hypothetical protein